MPAMRNALMPFQLPEAASISALTNPLMQGMQTYRQGMAQEFEGNRALERERLARKADSRADEDQSMQREARLVQRMGALAQVVADEPDEMRARSAWQRIVQQTPAITQRLTEYGVDPNNHRLAAKFLAAEAGRYTSAIDQQMKQAQLAQMGRQGQLSDAQLAQMKNQTPEARARVAAQYGLQPGTPEYNAFVLSGAYSPPDPMKQMIGQLLSQAAPTAAHAPGGPPTQSAPPPSAGPQRIPRSVPAVPPPVVPPAQPPAGATGLPVPFIPARPPAPAQQPQPQSFAPQPGQPQLIQAQQPGPAPVPQQPAAPPDNVQVPLFGQMPRDRAQALGLVLGLGGKGDAGKMVMDAANASNLGKEAGNENDKQELQAIAGLQRVRQIASGFKPEWLTYENRAKQYGVSWLDSFEATRKKLPPKMLKDHVEYTMFVRDAMSNLTQGIKDATGAAMGVQEEARIRAGLPDPQKDGPTQFAAKLQAVNREMQLHIARTQYLRRNGFRGDGNAAMQAMPVGQFSQLIQQRTNAIQQQILQQHPQAPPAAVQQAVQQQLQAEFGLNI